MAIAGSACLRASTSSRRVLLAEDQGPAWDTCDNGTGVTCVFPRMKRTLERITVSCLHSPVSFTHRQAAPAAGFWQSVAGCTLAVFHA